MPTAKPRWARARSRPVAKGLSVREQLRAGQHGGSRLTGGDLAVALDQQRAGDAVDVQEDQQVRVGAQGVPRAGVDLSTVGSIADTGDANWTPRS